MKGIRTGSIDLSIPAQQDIIPLDEEGRALFIDAETFDAEHEAQLASGLLEQVNKYRHFYDIVFSHTEDRPTFKEMLQNLRQNRLFLLAQLHIIAQQAEGRT